MPDTEFKDNIQIYHVDTDSYGVVWHGSCIKWFEKGRIELAKLYNADVFQLEKQGIFLPVVDLQIRYKSSAFLAEEVTISTKVQEIKKASIIFKHTVSNTQTGQIHILATSTIVAINKEGKLYKQLPNIFNK